MTMPAGRPQIDVATVGQGDTVEQSKAELPGKKFALNALFLTRPVPPERPDISIIGIVPPPVTEPSIGGIEHGIGGKTIEHHQTIGDTGGRVNREMRTPAYVRFGSKADIWLTSLGEPSRRATASPRHCLSVYFCAFPQSAHCQFGLPFSTSQPPRMTSPLSAASISSGPG